MNIDKAAQAAFNYYHEGNLDEAKRISEKILDKKPNNFNALHLLGIICYQLEEYASSVQYLRKAIQNNPHIADAYFNLGASLKKQGQDEEAVASYQKALQLNPDFVEVYNNLGIICYEHGQYEEAAAYYQKAVQLAPSFFEAYRNLGIVYKDQGKVIESENAFQQALQIKPDSAACYSDILFGMNYQSRYNNQSVFDEHLKFARRYAEPFSSSISPHGNVRDPHRRLKIGYISPDFRRHAVAYFIEPVFAAHNREHFETFCYSNSLKKDEVTGRIQEHTDQWRAIAGMSDEEVSELIRKDGIDILVDLAGHTGGNRILVFARKPAPVQVSWIGYLATTGLSAMDYRIADRFSDPPGKTEQYYTEKLMRMPESFLCYLPDRDSPEVGPLPALSTGQITFGSLNNFAKITPEVFTLWARVLKEQTDSRLILKGNSFIDKTTCQYARGMFTQRGVESERIVLQPPDPSPKHLESYNQIDIGLDPFPFNGATTTCEALWMGVPVVTLEGIAYHSRSGVSLLSNVGLAEFIAKTSVEYISIAVNLARDLKKLQSLRENLRDMMRYSPLCDAKSFTPNVEMCYRRMWETWCNAS